MPLGELTDGNDAAILLATACVDSLGFNKLSRMWGVRFPNIGDSSVSTLWHN